MNKILHKGQRFGSLLVLEDLPSEKGKMSRCLVRCDCGSEKVIQSANLRTGSSWRCKSCARREAATTHGHHGTLTYKRWQSMKGRCSKHPHYIASNISVCHRWQSFENFLLDIGECPSPGHSIDRINGSMGYVPGNCRWATSVEQANNTNKNVHLSAFGARKTLAQWSRDSRCGCCYATLRRRIIDGWPVEYAITEPPKPFMIRKTPCYKLEDQS